MLVEFLVKSKTLSTKIRAVMGLTLYYQGRIKDLRRIPELTTEVADICQSLDWTYHLIDDVETIAAQVVPWEPGEGDPKKVWLRGLFFTPPGCETAILVFSSSGRLFNLLRLQFADQDDDPEYLYMLHTKTQYAGEDVHIALVTLFKYLEKKYDLELKMSDEGNYWDTLDRSVLNERFEDYRSLIEAVGSALRNDRGPGPVDDRAGSLADWVERVLRERMGGDRGRES